MATEANEVTVEFLEAFADAWKSSQGAEVVARPIPPGSSSKFCAGPCASVI